MKRSIATLIFVLSVIGTLLAQESKQGWSGCVDLNYGFPNKTAGSMNLQYRKGIWAMEFGYNGHYSPTSVESELVWQMPVSGEKWEQTVLSDQINRTHNARLLLTAAPSSKDLFSFCVQSDFSKLTNDMDIASRRNETISKRKHFEGAFRYAHAFTKDAHEFSLDATFSHTKCERPTTYFVNNVFDQRSLDENAPIHATLQADYFKTVGRHGKIEAGVKGWMRQNEFKQDFRHEFSVHDKGEGPWMPNRAASHNHLEHCEYATSAYLMYEDRLSEKWSYKAGARMEYSSSSLSYPSADGAAVEKDFWHPSPTFSLQYRINRKHQLDFAYRQCVTHPTYQQLNPHAYIVAPFFRERGNKDLRPEVSDRVELNYTFHKQQGHFAAGVYGRFTRDFITPVTELSSPETFVLTHANGHRAQEWGLTLDMAGSLFPWFSMTRDFTLFYVRTSGMYGDASLRSEDVAFRTSSTITVNLDKKTDVLVFMNLVSAVDRPQFKFRPVTYGNVTLLRRFLNDCLTVSMTLSDVLNTNRWRAFSRNNPVYTLYNYSKGETRKFYVGLTYNFNSFKMNKRMQPKSGAEDNSSIRLGQ